MNGFRIIVEGKEDGNFLRQVLESFSIPVNQVDPFLEVGGKTMEKFQELSEILRGNVDIGVKLLAVIDADDDWKKRKQPLLEFMKEFDIEEEQVFVFPDDTKNGCLEDLLLELIPDEKLEIIECLNAASKCVNNLGVVGMDKKDIIHQYVSSNLTKKQRKQRGQHANEETRNYSDSTVWNLESEALQPLTNFLKKHLA